MREEIKQKYIEEHIPCFFPLKRREESTLELVEQFVMSNVARFYLHSVCVLSVNTAFFHCLFIVQKNICQTISMHNLFSNTKTQSQYEHLFLGKILE